MVSDEAMAEIEAMEWGDARNRERQRLRAEHWTDDVQVAQALVDAADYAVEMGLVAWALQNPRPS